MTLRDQRDNASEGGGLSREHGPRFASAALSTSGTQLLIALLGFASVLVMARSMGPAGRGEVALLTTITMMTATVGLLGLDEANINFAGRDPRARRALATNSLIVSVLVGAACIAVLAVLVALVPAIGGTSAAWLRWLAFASIPVLILKLYLKFLVNSDYRFGAANTAWLLPPLATFASNVGLAAAGHLTVTTAFVTWVAAHVAATVMLVVYVARRFDGFGRPSLGLARRTLRFGLKSHAGRVMMVGNYRVDQWFVGALAGPAELGLYSIAVAWTEVLFYLPTALTVAQRPYLVRAVKRDAGRRAARVFRTSVVLTAGLAGVLVVLAPLLCVTVFGSQFAGSVADLRVLALGALGVLALKLLGNALTAQGRPGLSSLGPAAAFVVTVVLDVVLIPSHGGLGAAMASVAAYTAGGLVTALMFLRFFGVRPRILAPRAREIPGVVRSLVVALASRARPREQAGVA